MTPESQRRDLSPLERSYPAPALVVGVGDLGLRVLEQLGSDWALLRDADDDPTVANLRLLHVRSNSDGKSARQPDERDRRTQRLARALGTGDLPSLAVDFALLRSLGLIRFYQGNYEVAVPQTGDLFQRPADRDDTASSEVAEDGVREVFRRRYFVWERLGADPIGAVERLALARESYAPLELFISPLLGRIRLGLMPHAVVLAILRLRAYEQGRDPAPWEWLGFEGTGEGEGPARIVVQTLDVFSAANVAGAAIPGDEQPRSTRHPPAERHMRKEHDAWHGLLSLREEPSAQLANAFEKFARARRAMEDARRRAAQNPGRSTSLGLRTDEKTDEELFNDVIDEIRGIAVSFTVPRPFVPDRTWRLPKAASSDGERESPGGLLVDADCVASFLAADMSARASSANVYKIFPTSLYRLGMFDHDSTPRANHAEWTQAFGERLEELADYVETGLIRLWSDLERDPGIDISEVKRADDYDVARESVRQTLALLGELFLRDVLGGTAKGGEDSAQTVERPPRCADTWLRNLEHPGISTSEDDRQRLETRLRALGFKATSGDAFDAGGRGAADLERRKLLGEAALGAEDLAYAELEALDEQYRQPDAVGLERTGLLDLRRRLNDAYKQLYAEEFLSRAKATTTPRLTVAVVGDIDEPFVRRAMRTVLREANGELRRTLGPIFSAERGGPEGYVSILPIIWAPHPPDASRDLELLARAREEVAVHQCIHGLRRWIEAIPGSKRSVRQIYLNDRVTDNAILSDEDAVRQTCAFLSLVLRNRVDEDPLLRMVHAGSTGASGFASFACRQLEFPERRAREYLAIQYSRTALRHLSRSPSNDVPSVPFVHGPQDSGAVAGDANRELASVTAKRAEAIAAQATPIDPATGLRRDLEPDDLAASFGVALDSRVGSAILEAWRSLVSPAGGMDALVERLRARVLADARDKLGSFRNHTNRLLAERSVADGVQQAQVDLQALARGARAGHDEVSRSLRAAESSCRSNGVPATDDLKSSREAVEAAALAKPSWKPIQHGVALLGSLGVLLGAPIFWAVAAAFGLNERPAVLEGLLYYGGPFFAGALVATLAYVLLGRFVDRYLSEIRGALTSYVDAVKAKVAGDGGSVKSFLAARLAMTTEVARRAHADVLRNQAEVDARNAVRLQQSVDLQSRELKRRLERLGVRFPSSASGSVEDVSRLFAGPNGEGPEELLSPSVVATYFRDSYGAEAPWQAHAQALVKGVGRFDEWREAAPLSNTREVLEFGRGRFSHFMESHVLAQGMDASFRKEAVERAKSFVTAHAAHLGFGADFDGLEGLDVDNNVHIEEDLVIVAKKVARDADLAEELADAAPRMRVREADVRPNSLWLLSLVNGLSARIVRTLHRYESALDRPTSMPSDAFPFAMEFLTGRAEPTNALWKVASDARMNIEYTTPRKSLPAPQEPLAGLEVRAVNEASPGVADADQSPEAEPPVSAPQPDVRGESDDRAGERARLVTLLSSAVEVSPVTAAPSSSPSVEDATGEPQGPRAEYVEDDGVDDVPVTDQTQSSSVVAPRAPEGATLALPRAPEPSEPWSDTIVSEGDVTDVEQPDGTTGEVAPETPDVSGGEEPPQGG